MKETCIVEVISIATDEVVEVLKFYKGNEFYSYPYVLRSINISTADAENSIYGQAIMENGRSAVNNIYDIRIEDVFYTTDFLSIYAVKSGLIEPMWDLRINENVRKNMIIARLKRINGLI